MILCKPFFFLLVDSSFGSALSVLAALVLACADVPAVAAPAAGGAVEVDSAPAGADAAGEPFGLPSLAGAGFAEGPGSATTDAVGVKTGTLLDGVKVEPVDGAAGRSEAGAGVVATAFGSFGAAIISNPRLLPGAEGAPLGTVVASTGAASAGCSGAAVEASVPETVNAGPLAPGFKISVAEIESFGGLICGVPAWAA